MKIFRYIRDYFKRCFLEYSRGVRFCAIHDIPLMQNDTLVPGPVFY